MKCSMLPADSFIVINKTILNDNDRKLLIMLYQPVIGEMAISLYFTLWSYLDKSELLSLEWTHHHLMTSMRTKLSDIMVAREKLEAIGLMKTYYKKDHINHYVYELYSPLSASEFLNNPILGTTLYNNVGAVEYDKIVDYFRIPKINLREYDDITCLFSDVFEVTHLTPLEHVIHDVKTRHKNELTLVSKIDLDSVFALIPEELLQLKTVTKDTRDLIYKLSFIYDLNEDSLCELIRNSVNEKKAIDKKLLRMNCRNYYQFEQGGKLPSIVYRNQPEFLRKPLGDQSKKAKIIYTFETTSPYDYMVSKSHGGKPSRSDLSILEYLLIDQALPPGVVNVLIDYVLKINNNKLTKAFIEAIASQWKRSKIETVEAAMTFASKEYQKRNQVASKGTKKKIEVKPDWFDTSIQKEEASKEEQAEIEKMLSEFK